MFRSVLFSMLCMFYGWGYCSQSYTLFESAHVRPLAESQDGKFIFAVNTPDNRLESFRVIPSGLEAMDSLTVGLEPVSVGVHGRQAWVVNHVSDSITVVDISNPGKMKIIHTLLVGDEPRDIVFAGADGRFAFITTAHRGQNHLLDPQLTTPGVGRADVWVFDVNAVGLDKLGGHPVTILTFFTDTPRALAVNKDGSKVYVAGFHTGNQTTTVFEELVPDGGEANGGLPSTRVDGMGEAQPETGLIVKYDGSHWRDELGRAWDGNARFSLPDYDVFAIDAASNPPRIIDNERYAHVGTVLFNMLVNPVSGDVYVTNTEALNVKRFEGEGLRLGGNHTVRGHLHESRISVLSGSNVLPRHLNKHINYELCCAPVPNDENSKSVAQPGDMAIDASGKTLYVTSFGTSKVAIYSTSELINNSFVPDSNSQVALSGGGPSGVVLDERRNRLYVLTRFDNSIKTVDLAVKKEVAQIKLHSPELPGIVKGRPFLYDTAYTSSHGDSSCAVCHVFADLDSLAWDLGNPDAATINNPGPFAFGPMVVNPDGTSSTFNPHFRALKGPMTTQSLRGLDNHGPMHWRGDRTGGNLTENRQPNSGAFDEREAFRQFNPAFVGLVGRNVPLKDDEMNAFMDFVLEITYPPNPIRNLDNSLTASQQRGRDIYFGEVSDSVFNCNGCHLLDRNGNKEFSVSKPGFFGTDGHYALVPEPQFMKIPHLRNQYQKVGMFGMAGVPSAVPGDNDFKGDQIRGFGFFHDGSVDTVFRFHGANIFVQRPVGALGPFDPGNQGGFPFVGPDHPNAAALNESGVQMRRDVEAFIMAYDSNMAPIVGQQVTFRRQNRDKALERIHLLKSRAEAGECDLIIKQRFNSHELGYLYANGLFVQSSRLLPPVSDSILQFSVLLANATMTYTCAPPGSGKRMALDRNNDGVYDLDENLNFGIQPAGLTDSYRN